MTTDFRASTALSASEQGPTDEELDSLLYYEFTTSNGHGERSDPIGFARAVLARWGRPAVEPVPVSERLPGPEDCDDQGRCWVGTPAISDEGDYGPITYNPSWELCQCTPDEVYWLPHWALPAPQEGADG